MNTGLRSTGQGLVGTVLAEVTDHVLQAAVAMPRQLRRALVSLRMVQRSVLVGVILLVVDGRVRAFMMPCQGQSFVLKLQRLLALAIAKAAMLEVIRNEVHLDGTSAVDVIKVDRGWALVRMAAVRGHVGQRTAAGAR